jgi:hypothetical protein
MSHGPGDQVPSRLAINQSMLQCAHLLHTGLVACSRYVTGQQLCRSSQATCGARLFTRDLSNHTCSATILRPLRQCLKDTHSTVALTSRLNYVPSSCLGNSSRRRSNQTGKEASFRNYYGPVETTSNVSIARSRCQGLPQAHSSQPAQVTVTTQTTQFWEGKTLGCGK